MSQGRLVGGLLIGAAAILGAVGFLWLYSNLSSGQLQSSGWTPLASYRMVLAGYAMAGLVLLFCFLALSSRVEPGVERSNEKRILGLHRSRRVVLKLSALFSLDAFAGGLIVQSMFALWFHLRFGVESGVIGSIFFGANILAGISALLAVRIAQTFGLINTMVFTHIPSNVLLILIPLMPGLPLAIALLLLRFSISQMDVPTRQSYTMAVVAPDERSAASGVTAIARSLGAALSPSLAGILLSFPSLTSIPFFLSGGLKIVYDVWLYHSFRSIRPPEELEGE